MRIYINSSRIEQRLDNFKKKLYPMLKQQIYKGSTKYCPYLSGDLQNSAQPSSVDETPYLVYNEPYARYQYYANGNAPQDFAGRTKNVHPLASCLWVEKYLATGGKQDIQLLCDTAPQILRF